MEQNARIVFIGGSDVGKTQTIKSLWICAKLTADGYSIKEDVPGRGEMFFSVIEMPPVLYSFKSYGYGLKESWFTEENKEKILNADTIVFLVQSKSFGYEREFEFLTELFSSFDLKNKSIPLIIGISKIDDLINEDELNGFDLVSEVLDVERYVNELIERYGFDGYIKLEDVVPYSSLKKIYTYRLKERIWGGVISHTNKYLYNENIPTLIISGKRGCGKSSTLNALFGFDFPVDRAMACTKYPRVMNANLECNGRCVNVNIVDLPGIAENIKADMKYYSFYKYYIERADVLLCLNQANVRAYKQDELFYEFLSKSGALKSSTSILIAMNHCDSLFKDKEHLDGVDLSSITDDNILLTDKIKDMFDCNYKHFFRQTHSLLTKDSVIPISAYYNWNIDKLKQLLILKLDKKC